MICDVCHRRLTRTYFIEFAIFAHIQTASFIIIAEDAAYATRAGISAAVDLLLLLATI